MSQSRRRRFLIASGGLLVAPLTSFGQPSQKVRWIGFLSPFRPSPSGVPSNFRESLRRAGYEEGKNLVIESRFAEGKEERLPGFAEELVRLKVELIVAVVNTASDAAKRATNVIPIVMHSNMFPVERGLVASLAHPGGNVTGTVWWAQPKNTVIKMYQIGKETRPNAKRAALIYDPTNVLIPFFDHPKQDRDLAAIGLTVTRVEMTRLEDFGAALKQIEASRAEILYVVAGDAAIRSKWPEIAAFAIERKLASFSDSPGYVDVGGLLTYGPDGAEVVDRTVSYVDRILRGAKPGDLPVEQASKYLLALNTKTAQAIGFKPSPSFMARVDRLVE